MWHDNSELVRSSGPALEKVTGDRTAAEEASQFSNERKSHIYYHEEGALKHPFS